MFLKNKIVLLKCGLYSRPLSPDITSEFCGGSEKAKLAIINDEWNVQCEWISSNGIKNRQRLKFAEIPYFTLSHCCCINNRFSPASAYIEHTMLLVESCNWLLSNRSHPAHWPHSPAKGYGRDKNDIALHSISKYHTHTLPRTIHCELQIAEYQLCMNVRECKKGNSGNNKIKSNKHKLVNTLCLNLTVLLCWMEWLLSNKFSKYSNRFWFWWS